MADGKKILYCDMDGGLADFMGADGAVERFRVERDFFFNLAPFEKNIQAQFKLRSKNNLRQVDKLFFERNLFWIWLVNYLRIENIMYKYF